MRDISPVIPASHGCVRMPEQNVIQFLRRNRMPVHVFGSTRAREITLSTVRNLHDVSYDIMIRYITDPVRSEICAAARVEINNLS